MARQNTTSYEAVVVGGGLAGLRAARDLSLAGHSVLLVDGRDRLGGRTWTRPFRGIEQPIELGGVWVAPEHHHYVAEEMDRYGLSLVEQHGPDPYFLWRFGGEASTDFPLEGDEIYELERALYRIIEANHRVDTRVPRDEQEGLGDLDISVHEFLRSCDLSPKTYEFLAAFGSLGSGAEAHEWSALTAFSLMAAFGCSAYAWFAGVVDKIEGGTVALVNAVCEEAAPDISLSNRIIRVVQRSDGVTLTTGDGDAIDARVAVMAVPANTWADIEFEPGLSAAKATLAREQHPNRMGKVWALVEGAPEGAMGFGPGNGLLFVAPQYDYGDASVMVGFTAPPSLIDVTDEATVTAAIHEYYPDARVLAVDAHDWNADSFSKGGWLTYRPGRATRLHSGLQTPEGRVLFAGADIAVRWIGWIDGALESGARAARQAVEQLKNDAVKTRGAP
jgi:monoamine oxidase